uniref:Exonuclease n=1 Tax=Siphoviridae sp. ct3Mm15 TaxID=2827558 RepID=A0A8S5RT68_9CAUD|nr:MAG TPA: Exonuclease [Siphoviridae sp. ct3Mm15]
MSLADTLEMRQWWDHPHPALTAADACFEIAHTIEDAIVNHPRSAQKRIGPSEIGNPCTHCLAARLAGWEKHERGIPWTTTKGTAIHFWLEHLFNQADIDREDYAAGGYKKRWLTEQTVSVGEIDGLEITGSTDLYDLWACQTVDWKFVGSASLKKYKAHGPSDVYRIQAHLYARGWQRAGSPCRTVSILFLPAASANWQDRYFWHEPYDENIALAALDRATGLARTIKALDAADPTGKTRDAWITGLDRDPNCFDCAKYDDHPAPTLNLGAGIEMDL